MGILRQLQILFPISMRHLGVNSDKRVCRHPCNWWTPTKATLPTVPRGFKLWKPSFVWWLALRVRILFLLLGGCTGACESIDGYVACVHHLTHCWYKLIARR